MLDGGKRRRVPNSTCYTRRPFAAGAVEETNGGDVVSTAVMTSKVHAERVVTLVNQSLQLFIVANDENYALAA